MLVKIANIGCLKGGAAIYSAQFVGRSEHTSGPKAQQSVDSSGNHTHNLHNTCVLERQAL